MTKVLKLQRVGLITPTVVEYEGKVLATNQLDIESTCNLWRVHFGFYPTEKVDIAMTKKQFSSIQQKTLSSVKSVYELFYERNFIPRVFEANEEHAEWGMYRNKELEGLEAENAALQKRLENAVELPTIYEQTIHPFIESLYTETIYYVVYKENGRIVTINCGKSKSTAEARLAEMKRKDESSQE